MRHGRFTTQGVLEFAHQFVETALAKVPDGMPRIAVDTTVGNGYDTLWLAKCVGDQGQVIGCDIQSLALDAATARLQDAGVLDRVTLNCLNHADLAEHIPPQWSGQTSAIMANLGYLPGGDKGIISESTTSLQMVTTLLPFLRIGGVMTLVLYSGHSGGRDETDAICTFAFTLDPKVWRVFQATFPNQSNSPPQLIAIERISS